MIFEHLKVKNLMGCNYDIEFDPKYTVIIGRNRQGKTLVARLIMLCFYGLGTREKDLHDSWKLRDDEISEGYVELIFKGNDNKRYKIYREYGGRKKVHLFIEKGREFDEDPDSSKETDIKTILDEEAGITPTLMNVTMSNEINLIGSISYDEKLQACVWEGWKWKSEIIKNNISSYSNKCHNERKAIDKGILDLKGKLETILKTWYEKEIFEDNERIDRDILSTKFKTIIESISNITIKINNYSSFKEGMNKLNNLEEISTIKSLIELCKLDNLDEKEEINNLKEFAEGYLITLEKVISKGRENGIRLSISHLDDEIKKLNSSKSLKDRYGPLKSECIIYPPDKNQGNLFIQIPDNISDKFSSEDIDDGKIAVKWSQEKEDFINENKKELEDLIKKFAEEKELIRSKKDELRNKIEKKHTDLIEYKSTLENKRDVLKINKENYILYVDDLTEKEKLKDRLTMAENWFRHLFNIFNEEENLKKIRMETISFINQIYTKDYGWDIIAEFQDDKIITKDKKGKIRSQPSGSEKHVMGMAWRWMIARRFNLPLVLDEIDSLLDQDNFEKTKNLIKNSIDRQIVILTYKVGLRDLPGKIYIVTRENGKSVAKKLQVSN